MKYSPQLDGIRAIAILAVLVFHAIPGVLGGGFTGVDVFFVLSGYLIASVILHDVREGSFSLREFYLRRIQRLLPNALLMVLAATLLAWFLLLPSAAVRVAQHGLWTIFNVSNFYIRRHVGGYWDDAAATIPLLHTWSLAVEEQFYLFFPWVLVWLAVRPRARGALIALTLVSFALGDFTTWRYPVSAFYLLPPRAWELLVGALLALHRIPVSAHVPLPRVAHSAAREALGWVGAALIVVGFFGIREGQGFPGYVALLPTLGALAVIAVTSEGQGQLSKWLGSPFMVTTGKLSYSLYLWHWPLIVIGRQYADLNGHSPQTGAIVGAGASVVVAALAYQFVEVPLRRRSSGRGRRLATIVVIFLVTALVCALFSSRNTSVSRNARFDHPTYHGQLYNVSAAPDKRGAGPAGRFAEVDFAPPGPYVPRIWNQGGFVHAWGEGPPRVVVLGSSHALMYSALIDDLCRQRHVPVAFLTADGASVFSSDLRRKGSESFPAPDMTEEFLAARARWVKQWHPAALFVIDRWDDHAAESGGVDRGMRELLGEFGPDVGRLIAVSQIPVLRLGEQVNLHELVLWRQRNTGHAPRLLPDTRQAFRDSTILTFAALEAEYPQLHVVRADTSFMLADGAVRYSSGRSFFYVDDDHLTDAGAEQVRAAFATAIDSALVTPPGR